MTRSRTEEDQDEDEDEDGVAWTCLVPPASRLYVFTSSSKTPIRVEANDLKSRRTKPLSHVVT